MAQIQFANLIKNADLKSAVRLGPQGKEELDRTPGNPNLGNYSPKRTSLPGPSPVQGCTYKEYYHICIDILGFAD